MQDNAKQKRHSCHILVVALLGVGSPLHADENATLSCHSGAAIVAPAGNYESLTSRLGAHLQELAAADQFYGAVLIARNGQQIFLGAYGCADRERSMLNTVDTRFRIGSISKVFTAVAVLQLIQAGKIKLDHQVGHYLKQYPNKELANKVTIRELLTHTGGTGDIFGPEFDPHRLELRDLSDYAKLYGARGPQFEPGSHFSYSNYGFILLGLILERVSGENYYDYVRRHVFHVAGMIATDSLPEDQPVARRALGYMRGANGQGWLSNAETLPYRGTPAGGGYSTANDLFRFAQALVTYRLLSERSFTLATTGKSDMWPGFKYGYGFTETVQNGIRWVGHNGGAAGMNGEFWLSPDAGYVLIVLSNLDPPSATQVAQWIAPLLPK
jgi:CubicO group peptidase (beta-lactamase class C family)